MCVRAWVFEGLVVWRFACALGGLRVLEIILITPVTHMVTPVTPPLLTHLLGLHDPPRLRVARASRNLSRGVQPCSSGT